MTTIVDAKQIIYDHFLTQMAILHSGMIVKIGNEDGPGGTDTTWVRIMARHIDRNQDSLGGVGARKFQQDGIIGVQIFSPLDAGSTPADTVAISVQTILEGKSLTSGANAVRTNSAVPNEIGPTEDGYQVNVSTAFYYHETK